jgi:two-component system, LytTR family, sensor kinase
VDPVASSAPVHRGVEAFLIGDLTGFAVGVVLTTMLVALTVRARHLPGTPRANVAFALSALVWNLGGLAQAMGRAAGLPVDAALVSAASAVQFSAAAVWPIPLLVIWRPFAVRPWQRRAVRVLQMAAPLAAAILMVLLWARVIFHTEVVSIAGLKQLTALNGSMLAIGAVVARRSPLSSMGTRASSAVILIGIFGSTAAVLVRHVLQPGGALDVALAVASTQSPLLIVFGAFLQFARFRFADVFIRWTLRVVLASVAAVILGVAWRPDTAAVLAALGNVPRELHVLAASTITAALLLLAPAFNRRLEAFVDTWIVGAPDYRRARRELDETLHRLDDHGDIVAAVRESARVTLEVEEVRWISRAAVSAPWPPGVDEGEVVELERTDEFGAALGLPRSTLLVPVRTDGRMAALLAIVPGEARRGLVTHEVEHLRAVALRLGSRLDALERARELADRQGHEAILRQQLTEAELRALRAQINPHFLFNALNTIADLIVTSPLVAETVTLHLARVFRHVLAHSSRPMTSVHDEIEFLRTYLEIEKARFGSRLHVEIDVPADAAALLIPSLILQPLVENALKHGLARKPGPGELRISVCRDGDHVRLQVEDDGAGIGTAAAATTAAHNGASLGVGLANVSRRLRTLYDGRARLTLEPREAGGTRASVVVPRWVEEIGA